MTTSSPSPCRNAADAASPLRLPLVRKLIGLTLLKLIGLAVIYALFFGPTHRLPLDPAQRIAGALPASSETSFETR